MNDSTLMVLRKLKFGNGQYIFQESMKEGEPSTILGKPVHFSDAVPDIGATAKPILFGDFSNYWIAERSGRYFQQLTERYAEMGQIGFKANQRVDGRLVIPESVKYLQMHA